MIDYTAQLRLQVVGYTCFQAPLEVPWQPDVTDARQGGSALAEFAGRACYQSWSRPNPRTANNLGYLRNILNVGHYSVIEHGSLSFYATGVSRSLTHELVRHRHFSFSQLSQRYVAARDVLFIEPEVIAEDPYLHDLFVSLTHASQQAYSALLLGLERKFEALPEGVGKKKQARQAARSVLPNATETRLVFTGNYRQLRHFIHLRASEGADVEIRALAIAVLRLCMEYAPNVFADFHIRGLDDGTEIAESSYREL